MRTNRTETDQPIPAQPYFSAPVGSFLGATLLGAALLVGLSKTALGAGADAATALLAGVSTYLAFAIWAAFRLHQNYPHGALGLCNLVTLGRLVIAGLFVIAIATKTPPSWISFGLAAVSLSLDGIDGWLARKQRLASEFGAWFDVAVDAVFALLLAVYAATSGVAAAYVILLGVPYYIFGVAKLPFPWLDQPLPERFSRKAVCVFQIGVLILLQAPLFAPGQLDMLIGLVALALIWSFGRDILWLRRAA